MAGMRSEVERIESGSVNDNYCLPEKTHLKILNDAEVIDNISNIHKLDLIMRRSSTEIIDVYPFIENYDLLWKRICVRKYIDGEPYNYSQAQISECMRVMDCIAAIGPGCGELGLRKACTSTDQVVRHARLSIRAIDELELMYSTSFNIPDWYKAYVSSTEIELDLAMISNDGEYLVHGDLQGMNILFRKDRLVGVLDWDGVTVSVIPMDICKSVWFLTRKDRRGFDMDPALLGLYCESVQNTYELPSIKQFAWVGALYFVPVNTYLVQLSQLSEKKVQWYIEWLSSFWLSFTRNSELLLADRKWN